MAFPKPAPLPWRPEHAKLEAEVLAKIRPSPEDVKRILDAATGVQNAAQAALDAKGIRGRAAVQGSVAKGTFLAGSADIDLFLILEPSVALADLEPITDYVGAAVLAGAEKKYAQHPYLCGTYAGHAVDLVPAYHVAEATGKMSAVDRTPFHTAWVRGQLDDSKRDAVRLAKAFLKAVQCYGAETAVGGLSGYLVEVLVLGAGGFHGFLEWAMEWKPGRRYAYARDEAPDDVSPVVVVDPVDPSRNCAAAVSLATMEQLRQAVTEYLANPVPAFYFPPPPPRPKPGELSSKLQAQGQELLWILAKPDGIRLDLVFPQFQRAGRTLQEAMEKRGFEVIRHAVWTDDAEVLFVFLVTKHLLPETYLHRGPVGDGRPNAERFKQKHAKNPLAVGPVEADAQGHLQVQLRNPARTALENLQAAWGMGLGKHVDAVQVSARIDQDPDAAPPAWQSQVADFVTGRKPWQN